MRGALAHLRHPRGPVVLPPWPRRCDRPRPCTFALPAGPSPRRLFCPPPHALFQILLLRCLKVLFGHPRRFDRPPRAARVASNLLREILLLSCANIALWLLMLRLRLRFRTMLFWFRTVVVQLPVLVGLRLCVLLILGLDG